MTTKEHEQTLNVRLSDELKARRLNAKPEVSHPGNLRIDVEVRIGPARIAVEAKHGQSSAKRQEAIEKRRRPAATGTGRLRCSGLLPR